MSSLITISEITLETYAPIKLKQIFTWLKWHH